MGVRFELVDQSGLYKAIRSGKLFLIGGLDIGTAQADIFVDLFRPLVDPTPDADDVQSNPPYHAKAIKKDSHICCITTGNRFLVLILTDVTVFYTQSVIAFKSKRSRQC